MARKRSQRGSNGRRTRTASEARPAAKDFYAFRQTDGKFGLDDPEVHRYGKASKVCTTNARGHETPE